MRCSRVIMLFVVTILTLMPLSAARGWEEVVRPRVMTEHIDSEDVDFTTREGYIYISTSRNVSVKIFTILGQTISQSTLTPGSYRFKLGAKGIYLIKIGTVTRRITI